MGRTDRDLNGSTPDFLYPHSLDSWVRSGDTVVAVPKSQVYAPKGTDLVRVRRLEWEVLSTVYGTGGLR